ncbi:hypothetical protein [Spectribacter hydrogenoxidans]|uniref:Formylmethanofuran dehydrogenase subunit E domain-containing protein n=1 Tax=Spectribacter hydrogenoxidans TaxID=3075608 RepID=A0ABU3C4M4_9GAMM|nr:hypothetical protein [Salinisphaera sp. W335]MDT0636289.1 hypothetical protein [Salinisphaera sp. W335]
MAVHSQSLQIAEAGERLTLRYGEALEYHRGDSWFGVAVGFRMLQAAGAALSRQRLWDRKRLFIVSGHPGDGVRDAVEYVTACASRGRYRVEGAPVGGCNPSMRFSWEVGDGAAVAALRLRGDFVPDELYALLERRGTAQERDGDHERFAALKRRLVDAIWDEPLAGLFQTDLLDAGMVGHA